MKKDLVYNFAEENEIGLSKIKELEIENECQSCNKSNKSKTSLIQKTNNKNSVKIINSSKNSKSISSYGQKRSVVSSSSQQSSENENSEPDYYSKKTQRTAKASIVNDKSTNNLGVLISADEFQEKDSKLKLNLLFTKKLKPTQTMLNYCKCQLYISYDNKSGFEFTGLEGILCIVINRLLSNLYIQIYEIKNFEMQFEIELYTNISLNRGYKVLSPKFHSIEFPTFCLGINFLTENKASEIKNIILNYSKALDNNFFYQFDKKINNMIIDDDIFQLEQIDNNNLYKKLNYKISAYEQILSFSVNKETDEVLFDASKDAHVFLKENNIKVAKLNEEYEKLKDKILLEKKQNKMNSIKNGKYLDEDLMEEKKQKIINIINQIDGLKDKNKIKNKENEYKNTNIIKKFSITNRVPKNKTLVLNEAANKFYFYGNESDSSEDTKEQNKNKIKKKNFMSIKEEGESEMKSYDSLAISEDDSDSVSESDSKKKENNNNSKKG